LKFVYSNLWFIEIFFYDLQQHSDKFLSKQAFFFDMTD